jgi:hypothetical protein
LVSKRSMCGTSRSAQRGHQFEGIGLGSARGLARPWAQQRRDWLAVVFIAMGQGRQGRSGKGGAQQKVSQVVHFGRTPRAWCMRDRAAARATCCWPTRAWASSASGARAAGR